MDSVRKQSETYYDILKVASNCSDKDIKDAYVKLSKQYHPDVKSTAADQQQTARFVKISEAYKTLSKPKTRLEYDEKVKASRSARIYSTTWRPNEPIKHRPWEIKPDFDPNPGPYYGVKGITRSSNFKVAAVLTAVGIFCGVFGFFAVRHSYNLKRQSLDEVSFKATAHHQRIRSAVENSTQDENIQRVITRIAASQAER